jgi:adenine-specific DNA methylase
MEAAPSGIKRIVVFDFDDTLVFTPTPEVGKPAYTALTGQPWKGGWWGNPKTLEHPVFDDNDPSKLNPDVAAAFQHFRQDPSTYVVVMTGRIAKFENRVKEILAKYNIHPNEFYFKDQKNLSQDPAYKQHMAQHNNDTFNYKEFVILNRLMKTYPDVQSVEIFDDREEHMLAFRQLGKNLRENWPNLKSVIIHDVRAKQNHVV